MRILHVCAEFYPLLKTGGLADVTGALPYAQQELGHDVRLLLPAFPQIVEGILEENGNLGTVSYTINSFAGPLKLIYLEYRGLPIYLIQADHLFNRPGNPYYDQNYQDYQDNFLRFALLGWVASQFAVGIDSWWEPEIIHAHDWHAGLTCAYLDALGRPIKSIFTIHNIAYQGLFNAHHIYQIGLHSDMFKLDGLEFHHQLSYLKAGIFYADQVTTVSPNYAKEITTDEFAHGFAGLLNLRLQQSRLHGVLNGVDYQIWNPQLDQLIKYNYRPYAMANKAKVKEALQQEFNLPVNKDSLLIVVVSRITPQKGIDLVYQALLEIFATKEDAIQFIMLGSGDQQLQQQLLDLQKQYPQQVGISIGYNEALSHSIIAGGDLLLVPSRFEPCGLTQLYALKYGTLPLVRNTGGLADSVLGLGKVYNSHKATGFVFDQANSQALKESILLALETWNIKIKWYKIRSNAMRVDFSWQASALEYDKVYYK